MNCNLCAKNFSGIVPYQQHLESEKHKKKVRVQLSGGCSEPTKQDEMKAAGITNDIHCPACNMSFDSFLQFQNHCMSLEHVCNVTKKNEAVAIDEADCTKIHSVSSTVMDSDHHNVQNSDAILPSLDSSSSDYLLAFSECKVCNKRFSGPEPYRQHLVSAAHKKKVDMAVDSPNTVSQNLLSKFECDSCKKVFSGPIPLRQHMVSDIHKKKLQQLELLKSYFGEPMEISDSDLIKSTKTNIEITTCQSFFCDVCMIQCSGPAPYDQHIKGETHSKNLKKLRIQSFGLGLNDMTIKQDTSANDQLTFASPMLNVGVRNLMEVDCDKILHEALQDLNVVQPKDVNIKEFLPDDLISFDVSAEINIMEQKKKIMNTTDGILGNKQSEEIERNFNDGCQENGNNKEYEKCELCNVPLRSKKETLLHYESIEHIKKKYPMIVL